MHVPVSVQHVLIHADSNVDIAVPNVLLIVEQNAILYALKSVLITVVKIAHNHVLKNVEHVVHYVTPVLACV